MPGSRTRGSPIPQDALRTANYDTAPTTRTLSTTSARTAALEPGVYEITSDVDCFFLVGGSTVAATTSSIPLWAKSYQTVDVQIAGTNDQIAGIVASGTGTMYIRKPRGTC